MSPFSIYSAARKKYSIIKLLSYMQLSCGDKVRLKRQRIQISLKHFGISLACSMNEANKKLSYFFLEKKSLRFQKPNFNFLIILNGDYWKEIKTWALMEELTRDLIKTIATFWLTGSLFWLISSVMVHICLWD